MEEPKILKTITPIDCPHCKKIIFVGFRSMIPSITSIVTSKEIQEAKDEVIEKLNDIKFKDEKEKQKIIDWLNKEATLIDAGDIESILRQVVADQSPEKEK